MSVINNNGSAVPGCAQRAACLERQAYLPIMSHIMFLVHSSLITCQFALHPFHLVARAARCLVAQDTYECCDPLTQHCLPAGNFKKCCAKCKSQCMLHMKWCASLNYTQLAAMLLCVAATAGAPRVQMPA